MKIHFERVQKCDCLWVGNPGSSLTHHGTAVIDHGPEEIGLNGLLDMNLT